MLKGLRPDVNQRNSGAMRIEAPLTALFDLFLGMDLRAFLETSRDPTYVRLRIIHHDEVDHFGTRLLQSTTYLPTT
jgi:hypothetical protein